MADGVDPAGSTERRAAAPPKGRAWKALLLLGLSAAVLAWLVHDVGGEQEVLGRVRRADATWIAVSFVALGGSIVFAVQRWRLVLGAMGQSLAFRTAAWALLATWPLSIVSPSRANDLLRAHALRQTVPPVVTVASVLAERAVDLGSLCLLAAAGAAYTGQLALGAVAGLAAAAEWVVIVAAVRAGELGAARAGRYRDKVERLVTAFRALFSRPSELAGVGAFSLAAWLSNVAILFALAQAFDARVAPGDALALWPLALFVGLLPVTLGGLGSRDAAFSYLLQTFAARPPERPAVLAATVGYALLTNGVLALVGVPFTASWWLGRAGGERAAP